MGKKQDRDQKAIDDLLKKLQASYLKHPKYEKNAEKENDTSDQAFQKKLASMLGKVTENHPEKAAKKAKKEPVAAQESPSLPNQIGRAHV